MSDNFDDRIRELARQLEDSGAAALSSLYDECVDRLLRLAVTITRNQHDAEDAIQAAMMKVAAAPKRLSNADRPWHYLLTMARNEAIVVLRKRKKHFPIFNIRDLLTRRSVDTVEQEETHRAVWVALRRLPPEQSSVIVLKIWEGLTFAEIASVVDVSPSTAASRYRYGIAKLSGLLGDLRREACDA
jgi:RNA polymerase sigma-70 factor (ECF subfamily)